MEKLMFSYQVKPSLF